MMSPNATSRAFSLITCRAPARKPKPSSPNTTACVVLLETNPLAIHSRSHGWRVCIFRSGTYALYYREFDAYWLVAGIFHALRDPDWVQTQLLIREVRAQP
jgi:hypothetical protein